MSKIEMMNKVKQHMEWIAKNARMEPMRRADQCFGALIGAKIALGIDDDEELTAYWEDLRAEIFGYHR